MRELFNNFLRHSGLEEKEYQYEGVAWCYNNETSLQLLVHGGFIVDEMGLGKTIIMIGLFVVHYLPRTLIVLPPVLIDQWLKQIQKTTGHTSLVYHGSNKKNITLEQLNNAHIVITTYGAIKKVGGLLHQVDWSRIVLDEAHHIRNKNTQIFKGVKLLKSKIRWFVSGTPVQNSKNDFYSLCSALNMPSSFYKDPNNLRTIATCYMLRRTKVDVGIVLPEVTINNHIVKWKNEKEKQLSHQIHSSFHFNKKEVQPTTEIETETETTKTETETTKTGGEKMSLLCRFIRAKQSCILPRLVTFGDVNSSSKLDYVLDTLVSRRHNDKGKLVFCHFREEIDEIKRRLLAAGFKNVATFDGRTSREERVIILNSKTDVLILQIQTGCEGLNLQEHYSEIYFVSPHWNPAVEDQAIARCHRIGQRKTVDVFRFEMEGFLEETKSIDNYVTSVQDNKRIIANNCLKKNKRKREKEIMFIIEEEVEEK